jgi:hypothetical protein
MTNYESSPKSLCLKAPEGLNPALCIDVMINIKIVHQQVRRQSAQGED